MGTGFLSHPCFIDGETEVGQFTSPPQGWGGEVNKLARSTKSVPLPNPWLSALSSNHLLGGAEIRAPGDFTAPKYKLQLQLMSGLHSRQGGGVTELRCEQRFSWDARRECQQSFKLKREKK